MRINPLAIGCLLLCSCAMDRSAPTPGVVPTSAFPPGSTITQDQLAGMKDYVQRDVTFPVEINPIGVDPFPGELKNLRERFLLPISSSPYSSKIEKVVIDASALEWAQWTCRIELKEYMSPITITHFGGLYDGRDNRDSDGYRTSRPYVLKELDRIAQRVGWNQTQGEQAAPSNP